jgi:Tfp pilus assembly protein PilO
MVNIKTFINSYKIYLTKAAIMWAACLVLFVFAYMFVLGPQKDSRRNLENEITEKKQQYEMAQIAAREQTKAQLNKEIEGMRSTLKDFVVDLKDSANLTFDIGQIANDEKVSSFSIKNKNKQGLSDIPDCNCISESHIDIGFIAGFNQFATFVNALERHQPVLFVNEFSIARSNKDSSAYQVTLDVAAFVKKQHDREIADQSLAPAIDSKI